jgi:hypothetical protein
VTRKLEHQQVDAVVQAYLDGESCAQVASRFGVWPATIHVWLRKRGVKRREVGRRKTLTESQINDVVSAYASGISSSEVGQRFGMSRDRVKYYVGMHGSLHTPSSAQRKYSLNEDAFDVIDNETAAYWLGFIAADGCVHDHTLKVALSQRDLGHLERFRDWIQPERPLYCYCARGTSPGRTRDSYMACIAINSHHLTSSLAHLGIVPRKTQTLAHLPDIAGDMLRHYLRGYTDGDGYLACRQRRHQHSMFLQWMQKYEILGTESFLKDYRGWLHTTLGIPLLPIRQRQGIWSLSYSALEDAARIVTLLYSDATVCLERKRTIADQIIHRAAAKRENKVAKIIL